MSQQILHLLEEEVMSLSQVGRLMGCHPATVWRWCVYGKGGVRLESFQGAGAGLKTTKQALGRFIETLTAKKVPVVDLDRASRSERAKKLFEEILRRG